MFEIFSEIGQLESVILHRPGEEINNLTPNYLSEYLFEDIPFLQKAQEEHDELRRILVNQGVTVYLVTELLKDIFSSDYLKKSFIVDFLKLSNISNPDYIELLNDYLLRQSKDKFVEKIISGVKISDIHNLEKIKKSNFYNSQLFIIPPMPNLLYQRDPAFVIGNVLNLSTLSSIVRKREPFILKTILENHSLFKTDRERKNIYETNSFNIEGGDIQVMSKNVALIGLSKRTEPTAIYLLAKKILLESSVSEIYAVEIPKNRAFMHLDTVFTQVDVDKFVYHSEIFKNVEIYKLSLNKDQIELNFTTSSLEELLNKVTKSINIYIPCGGEDFITRSREQWNDGANTFAIKPGKVITYDRNIKTNELLVKNGIDIIPIQASELSRGRGGPHCLTLPLKRK
jgi:arginine deiminase